MSNGHYVVSYEGTFRDSLERMGLSFAVFEGLAKHGIDTFLGRDPYEERSTHEVTGTGGYRMLWTERNFGDLPAMAIAYRIDNIARTVFIVGADPVWTDEDLPPGDWF